MPMLDLGNRSLYYEDSGSGEPVLLVPGSGARGHTWLHQVTALVDAGYRVVTMDNRGAGLSTPVPAELTLADLVADVRDLAAALFDTPYRLVGNSMGALIAQELLADSAAKGTDVGVRQAVLIASGARPNFFGIAWERAQDALLASGLKLPAVYDACVRASQYLSPSTLSDDRALETWLDLFELSPVSLADPGYRAQRHIRVSSDRRSAYAEINAPCLVLSFADDVVFFAAHGRELADAIPDAKYFVIPDTGHYGNLERPDLVNEVLLNFFSQAD